MRLTTEGEDAAEAEAFLARSARILRCEARLDAAIRGLSRSNPPDTIYVALRMHLLFIRMAYPDPALLDRLDAEVEARVREHAQFREERKGERHG